MASAERPSTIYALPDAELTRPWEASNAVVDRVYIIGAGASVAYGLPTLKWLTWDLYQSLNRKDRKIFLAAVYEAFSETLRKDKQPPDFEELLNRLDPRALLYLQDSGLGDTHALRPQASKVALSGLRAFILDRCRLVAEQTGPYDSLVRSLSIRSAVVSFNWDVLLECAFIRAGRPFAYLPTEYSEGSTVLLKPRWEH